MLVTLKEILKMAEEKKMAVGAFNAANLESLQAVLGAAEELGYPVIIQFAQCHEAWIPLELIGPVMVEQAKKAAVGSRRDAGVSGMCIETWIYRNYV